MSGIAERIRLHKKIEEELAVKRQADYLLWKKEQEKVEKAPIERVFSLYKQKLSPIFDLARKGMLEEILQDMEKELPNFSLSLWVRSQEAPSSYVVEKIVEVMGDNLWARSVSEINERLKGQIEKKSSQELLSFSEGDVGNLMINVEVKWRPGGGDHFFYLWLGQDKKDTYIRTEAENGVGEVIYVDQLNQQTLEAAIFEAYKNHKEGFYEPPSSWSEAWG